jgi:hypothetical protein
VLAVGAKMRRDHAEALAVYGERGPPLGVGTIRRRVSEQAAAVASEPVNAEQRHNAPLVLSVARTMKRTAPSRFGFSAAVLWT